MKNKEDLRGLLHTGEDESGEKGLKLSRWLGIKNRYAQNAIFSSVELNSNKKRPIKCLGALIISNGKNNIKITLRIAQATANFQ